MDGEVMIAITIGIALYATGHHGENDGGILPMIAKAVHMDPAIMAVSPDHHDRRRVQSVPLFLDRSKLLNL